MSCVPTDWAGFILPRCRVRRPENVCGGGDVVKIVGISEKSRKSKL